MNKIVTCNENTSGIALQLHITGRCNQKCKHCYHNEYLNEPMKLEDIRLIIEQYKELISKYNDNKKIKEIGHISVTGGEPFIRNDFMDILKIFCDNREYFKFSILTNGSFITEEVAKKLISYGVNDVQVSIDGSMKTHDFIRGEGNFNQTFKAIDILVKYKIPTIVSFTANKFNYMEFEEVARCCEKHRVNILWSDRLVPIGNGKKMYDQCLSPTETLEYFKIMKKVQDDFRKRKSLTYISIDRALQFIVTKQIPHRCVAGDSLITIDEFGNLLPCRRMPIKCGNVLKDNLSNLYFNSEIMNELRTRKVSSECSKCRFQKTCNGGAKCISYAINNDFNKAEPFCPLIYYKRNNNIRNLQ
ncbi:radical SAM protein [Clostridium sp. MSJ-8]|uniref:radical SAM/SPASM domain-containing protein n=1 Tax=Clostridium sp. MSJ-8 TaxID=2841510 RepID=UPI001C0EDD3B|nr:radical SAM protein [Clostridium sp. MSJ-8]MBU5488944.1 radical SAM protein [Clostridium sp. MSJ-8]